MVGLNLDYSNADEYIAEFKPKQVCSWRGTRVSVYRYSYLAKY